MGRCRDDAGFTLIETMVSMSIIGVVMMALTSFFIGTTAISRQQGDTQTAIQLAFEATERVGAMRGSDLVEGRDQASTDRQWAAPAPAGVPALLATMAKVADSTAPALPASATSTAELPTTVEQLTRNGVAYQRRFYLGACWQPAGAGVCDKTQVSGYLAFFRVVVAVTWSSRRCPADGCVYATAVLVSSSPNDPVFDPVTPVAPPVAQNPGPQIGQQDVPVNLQLTATGGTPPLSWTTASGLPPGLSMDVSGLITGIPTTVGLFTWSATVQDSDGRTSTVTTTWTVRARPQVTGPGNQTTISGTTVSVTATMTGGTAPFTWQATGLPPGLSISTSGVITGAPDRPVPPTAVTYPVTVTVTDGFGASASRTFNWTVIASLVLEPVDTQDTHVGKVEQIQLVATGGIKPYIAWSATGLPKGLSIDNTGRISGHVTGGPKTYTVTVTVVDSTGTSMSADPFEWIVYT